MPHDYFWQWHLWVFPMFMPIFWLVIIGLCLYFIFGRGGVQTALGLRLGIRNRPGYPEKTLRQRGNQQRRVRADEAGYSELKAPVWGKRPVYRRTGGNLR